MIRSSKKFPHSPIPFPPANQKKNNLTAKCEAALEEVAAQAQPYFTPAEKKPVTVPAPKKPEAPRSVRAQTLPASEQAPRTPIRSRETPPPKSAPADDDFASQYANFDEASVAPGGDADHFSQSIDVPAPVHRDDSAALKAAEARVPAAIRDYLATRFQVRFDRYVPAAEARIFSARGEIASAEAQDSAADEPELSPELDD